MERFRAIARRFPALGSGRHRVSVSWPALSQPGSGQLTPAGWYTAEGEAGKAAPARATASRRRRRGLTLVMLAVVSAVALASAASAATAADTWNVHGTNTTLSAGSNTGTVSPSTYTCPGTVTGSTATKVITPSGLSQSSTADNTTAIQNAINTAGKDGGGVVTLPAGAYTINGHLVMKNNVELTGAGTGQGGTTLVAGSKFLKTTGTGGGYPIVSTAGADNVTIANLIANQSGNTLNGNVATRLSSYVVEARDSTNILFNNVSVINPFTYSIAIVASSNFCVENSSVNASTTDGKYNQLDGIHVLDSNTGAVINNNIISGDDGLAAHTLGEPVYNVVFANNTVDGGTGASGLQFAVGSPFAIYGITVENNDFTGSELGIHTGYYGATATANVYNITMSDNYIYNLVDGSSSTSIQMGDSGQVGTVYNVTISNTLLCNAGPFVIQAGSGDSVAAPTTTTSC
jgi:polygalacturonase